MAKKAKKTANRPPIKIHGAKFTVEILSKMPSVKSFNTLEDAMEHARGIIAKGSNKSPNMHAQVRVMKGPEKVWEGH